MTTRAVPEESPRKLNILLAEDNAVNRVLAQELLQKQGHTVTSVNNGIEALQLWEENQSRQFDIILMDVQMPERTACKPPRASAKEIWAPARTFRASPSPPTP